MRLRKHSQSKSRSYKYHGNWCGPGWTAGKRKDASDVTPKERSVPAISPLDQACKEHDIGLADAKTTEDVQRVNEKFVSDASKTGLKGKVAAKAVEWFGPSQPSKRKGDVLMNDHVKAGKFFTPPKRKIAQRPKDAPSKKLKFDSPNAVTDLTPSMIAKPSVPNLLSTTTMNRPAGSGNESGLKETPVDDVVNVERGPSPYTFATLPYVNFTYISRNAYSSEHVYRMTSPYDVTVGTTATDLNAGAGTTTVYTAQADSVDVSADKARWFDYYAGIYNYYHTISARWHITIENHSGEPLWVHWLYGNDTQPPQGATNADILCWNDAHSHFVNAPFKAIAAGIIEAQEITGLGEQTEASVPGTAQNFETSNNVTSRGPSHILEINGQYATGDYQKEIRLDSEVENWTSTSANPSLAERLYVRVRSANEGTSDSSASSYDRRIDYKIFARIEYLVEFKELKPGLRYPVQEQPLTVTVGQNVNVNT